jgi:hypothetical protein
MMVQGKGITAKWGAGFCFRAVHQRGMAATGRDVRWVKSVALTTCYSLPVYPNKQTLALVALSSVRARSSGLVAISARVDGEVPAGKAASGRVPRLAAPLECHRLAQAFGEKRARVTNDHIWIQRCSISPEMSNKIAAVFARLRQPGKHVWWQQGSWQR